jgi:hypothetical protein
MSTTTAYDFKTKAQEAFKHSKDHYLDDLNAMSQEALTTSPGGCARTPADFTYEIIVINKRIATRLKGEDPGPFKFEGWMKAPEELCDKDALIKEFTATCEDIESALSAIPGDEMLRTIQLPKDTTNPYDLVRFTAYHMGYHDAQLNYIQALANDGEMHWKFDD